MRDDSLPSFSVIVPTRNRQAHLEGLLNALARLDYPLGRFEVIVVDDGGRVPLEPVVAGFRNRLDLTLLRQTNTGPAAARNHGAARASGQYLAFTDDDCRPEPGWLRALAATFRESPEAVCGGRTVSALPGNPYSAATQLLGEYLYEHYNPVNTPGAFFASNNLAVARTSFLAIGGFDPTLRFGEDRDLCRRWALHGGLFRSAPGARVHHAHALGPLSFPRLHFCYGAGSYQFRRRAARRKEPPVKLSPPSWYFKLVWYGIRREKGPRGLLLSFLLAVALAANTAGILCSALTGLGERPSAGTAATAA